MKTRLLLLLATLALAACEEPIKPTGPVFEAALAWPETPDQ